MEETCRLIDFGGGDYERTVALRQAVLRTPLGLTFNADDLSREGDDLHLAVITNENRLLGCLVLTTESSDVIRMRQVAIEPEHQGKGVGSRLVRFSEEVARARGFRIMTMHARATAIPFYQRLGYLIEGDEYEEVGIPHRTMWKDLTTNEPDNELDHEPTA